MTDVRTFYDGLAESYHLIFEDWDRSIERQGGILAPLILENWPMSDRRIIDAAVGIGTQTLALAKHGFDVIGADISPHAVERARREAARRGVEAGFLAADFRALPFDSARADVVIACDNALPHLLSFADIRQALAELKRCARPGGGVLISMRDYPAPPAPGTVEHHPYGEREWNGRRYVVEQEWLWNGPTYRLTMRIRPLDASADADVVELQTLYFAIPVASMLELLQDVGFTDVRRVDGVFYQPLLLGTVPD